MFEWNLKDVCKNQLSEKDGNRIVGYCMLKTRFFFDYPWKKKFLDEVSWSSR